MPLLILCYPFVEIYLLIRFAQIFSFWDVLFFIVSTGGLGILIMSMFGKALLMEAQKSFSGGRVPDGKVLHRVLIFLGGVLIFLPGVLSDLVGLLMILPGTRHLMVWYLRWYLARAMTRGTFRFFQAGSRGFSFGAGFNMRQDFEAPQERDAEVIEIEALESQHTKKD
jgi:UPF0716 protein FxsA